MPPRNISILLLVTQLERAGAQKVALMQARYFHQHGYKVTLCFFYDKYNLMEELSQQEAFSIIDLEAKSPEGSVIVNVLRTLRAMWRLYRLLRRERIQVIETLTHYSNILGIVGSWLAGVPARISSQRSALLGFPARFLRLDALLVNSHLVDQMVAVSEKTRRFCVEVEGMRSEKVIVIPNGIDIGKYDRDQWRTENLQKLRDDFDIPSDAPVLITVGRLHQKGHKYLVQAAAKILMNYPRTIFMLVGDGEERTSLEQQIRQQGLADRFRLLGAREDVPQLLAISDLFVLPSISEGMPNVILEAMAAKLPTVATAVGGIPEVVVDGETGLLVPPADADALGQAIVTLLADEARRREMGERGYERVRRCFSEQRMCCQYEELMLSILSEKEG